MSEIQYKTLNNGVISMMIHKDRVSLSINYKKKSIKLDVPYVTHYWSNVQFGVLNTIPARPSPLRFIEWQKAKNTTITICLNGDRNGNIYYIYLTIYNSIDPIEASAYSFNGDKINSQIYDSTGVRIPESLYTYSSTDRDPKNYEQDKNVIRFIKRYGCFFYMMWI